MYFWNGQNTFYNSNKYSKFYCENFLQRAGPRRFILVKALALAISTNIFWNFGRNTFYNSNKCIQWVLLGELLAAAARRFMLVEACIKTFYNFNKCIFEFTKNTFHNSNKYSEFYCENFLQRPAVASFWSEPLLWQCISFLHLHQSENPSSGGPFQRIW